MLKIFKKHLKDFVKYVRDDYDEERYLFIRALFSNPISWKEHETLSKMVITGLTPLQVHEILEKELVRTKLSKVYKILADLESRQIIATYHRTKAGVPIYRALNWF